MSEKRPLHAYDTLSARRVKARQQTRRIEAGMKTSGKTLGPATDQGNVVQLLTTEEVAVWLQVAPKTLRNWRSGGIGPTALKLHSVVRYDRAAVEAWIGKTSKTAA